MLVGIDFDNTLVSYDELFAQAAVERGLFASHANASKRAIRDELRRTGREDVWTEMQGYVYGELIRQAPMFPGVREFFAASERAEAGICIISHKTRQPYLGDPYDLRQAALDWLAARGIAAPVYFEETREDKLHRIGETRCTHFIDDLPEFLLEPEFPTGVRRILFHDSPCAEASCFDFTGDWRAIARYLFPAEGA
jgi:hypothetical protein